ncbi:TOMM precursor leader peptide-binding protein [Flexivirga alba]|uniref:TOMM leader peptide-binding protein n=1 Tax=Flexivirga alba TaxID=702742 RepID=A0ABW2AIB9_9MICO
MQEEAPSTQAVQGDDSTIRDQAVFWGRHLGIAGNASAGSEVQSRLAVARVLLVSSGTFGTCVAELLRGSGVGMVETVDAASEPPPSTTTQQARHTERGTVAIDSLAQRVDDLVCDVDLVVCAVAGVSTEVPTLTNRICCDTDTRLLLAVVAESRMDLGPLVQPGESACYECMRLREQSMSSSAMENLLYRAHVEGSDTPTHVLSEALPVAALYASLVVMEAVRILTGIAAPTLLNHVTSVEGVRGTMCTNRVSRVPRCPVCSRTSVHTTATDFV